MVGVDQARMMAAQRQFPWKCFIWICPTDKTDPQSQITLNEWLNNIKSELTKFIIWTQRGDHDEYYTKYRWTSTIVPNAHQTIRKLAVEVLDETVIHVINSSYDVTQEQIKDSCDNENDSLKSIYFEPDLNEDSYKARITNAWTSI